MGKGMKSIVCLVGAVALFTMLGCGSSIYHPATPLNQWTWVGGSNTANQAGTYGTQGTPASGNVPGARSNAVSWTDNWGNFWLFGGSGLDSAATQGQLNDLWVDSNNRWTWVSGSSTVNQPGSYGNQGTGSTGNTPGARSNAVSWTDYQSNLWLFGGSGIDSVGIQGQLSDLWVFNRSQWIWVSGSNLANQKGIYGTQGTGAGSNLPGARSNAVSWTDNYGNLWLFGGYGYDSAGTLGQLNDLWVFNGRQWTWVSGSNIVNQAGTYGTQGTGAAGNVPGARSNAVSWTDYYGNLWLFGGAGYDSAGTQGQLNDLWVFNGKQWTWVNGANTVNQAGTYGTQGTGAAGNVPGARSNAVAWVDGGGNLWLFGGTGLDSAGTQGQLNDLWAFNGKQWVWVNGADTVGQSGVYGTQGKTASGNVPGSRADAVSWTDGSGNLWLFGGTGYDSGGAQGQLNDLWAFVR